MKKLIGIAVVAWAAGLPAAQPASTAVIRVDPSVTLGPVKLMNSVNGGPNGVRDDGVQPRGNFDDYAAARIPYARTHDCINQKGGAHACDISAIFPNFGADENDPKSYDFVFTDHYLDIMVRAGTKPFFRLGQTIEQGPKKYHIFPPKDYAKWARVCEHVVRHYNEGWGWGTDTAHTTQNVAWSNQFGIVYWEIWNEADLDRADDPKDLRRFPRTWGGTVTNFFELFETTAKHLKAKFPNLRIGGPALADNIDVGRRLLAYCRDRQIPLDFFSFHRYAVEPKVFVDRCKLWRKALDEFGFAKTELIIDEWNYIKGGSEDWPYSLEVERGRYNQKCAAFIAATMIECHAAPVDQLIFYDARPNGMNALFEMSTLWPMKGYYPFYAWGRLVACGTQIATKVNEGRGSRENAETGTYFVRWKEGKPRYGDAKGQFRAFAAKSRRGRCALLIARYSDDNNVTDIGTVWISVPGVAPASLRCHLTDTVRTFTEVPLVPQPDGTARLKMMPNSFALVEWTEKDAPAFAVTADHPDALYRCGETAVFTVSVRDADGALVRTGSVAVGLDNYGTATVVPKRTVDLAKENPIRLSGTRTTPGFLRLTASNLTCRSSIAWSVGYEPEKIVPQTPEPKDFDAFWNEAKRKFGRDVPVDVRTELVPERSTGNFNFYRVSTATYGRRVYGWLTEPKNAKPGSCRVQVHVAGAGIGSVDCETEPGTIHLMMNVHDYPQIEGEGAVFDKFRLDALEDENRRYGAPHGVNRYFHAGISKSREDYFFYPVILGLNRTVDWLAKNPKADLKNFTYCGSSQGGAMGCALLALNDRFTRAGIMVPAMTDTLAGADGRQPGWPYILGVLAKSDGAEGARRWMPYFDTCNFAARIRCPVRFLVGFADAACAPHCVYAAYNRIPARDKAILNAIGQTHRISRTVWKNQIEEWVAAPPEPNLAAPPEPKKSVSRGGAETHAEAIVAVE